MNFASAEMPLPIAIHATDGTEKPYSGQRRLTVMPHNVRQGCMCNLYRLNKPAVDIAHLFGVETTQGANYSEEVYPGYPGLVMAGRRLKVMNWGFPLIMTGRNGQKLKPKPVTNARDDKLSTAFWRASFESRRCLIPVSAWAEPEGEPAK
jgi:putative SOS response-associated peptidase YedK